MRYNHNGYQKSRLFEYGITKGFRWDKRKIKREIHSQTQFREKLFVRSYPPIDIDEGNRWKDLTREDYRFFRAMLGLPELYEYLVDDKGKPDQKNKYQVKFNHPHIKRFRSPLTFKYFGRSIYVIAENIPDGIFGATFSLTLNTKNAPSPTPLTTLTTPSRTEFDLIEFLDTYLPKHGYKAL